MSHNPFASKLLSLIIILILLSIFNVLYFHEVILQGAVTINEEEDISYDLNEADGDGNGNDDGNDDQYEIQTLFPDGGNNITRGNVKHDSASNKTINKTNATYTSVMTETKEDSNANNAIDTDNKQDMLPNFRGKSSGGLMLFYHTAKTGGTSVRHLFERVTKQRPADFSFQRITIFDYKVYSEGSSRSSECNPTRSNGVRRFKMINESIEKLLTSNSTSEPTLLLEIHGGEFGLKNMAPYIAKWRELSHSHNKPFFAFTLIRDPISYTMSYFNFFHYKCDFPWCEKQYTIANESSLISSLTLHPNTQCFLMIYDMHVSFYKLCPPVLNDCEDIYNLMKEQFDWVGTTEKLSHETIPLLVHMLVRMDSEDDGRQDRIDTKTKYITVGAKNVSGKGVQKPLGTLTILNISSLSNYDQMMYDRVLNDYPFDRLYPSINSYKHGVR